jgi:hypothetical protein
MPSSSQVSSIFERRHDRGAACARAKRRCLAFHPYTHEWQIQGRSGEMLTIDRCVTRSPGPVFLDAYERKLS